MILFKFYKNDCGPCEKLNEMLSEVDLPEGLEVVGKSIHVKENLHYLKDNGFNMVPVLMFEDGRSLMGLPTREVLAAFIADA